MKTKISIRKSSGWITIEAEQVAHSFASLAVHPTVNPARSEDAWSVTEITTGARVATGSSPASATRKAKSRIDKIGGERFAELVAGQVPSPAEQEARRLAPFEDLKVARVEPAPKADIPHIVDLVAKGVGGLSERERAAVTRALNSRTGQLKAKSPSAFGDADEALAAAAWQGLQPNGYKVGIVSVFSLRGEARELYEKLSKVQWPAAFDKDKLALVNAGVW